MDYLQEIKLTSEASFFSACENNALRVNKLTNGCYEAHGSDGWGVQRGAYNPYYQEGWVKVQRTFKTPILGIVKNFF